MHVEMVHVDRILPLRRAVLRPGRPIECARFEGDDEAETRHFAAITGDRVVGCATLLARPYEDRPAWQLRGMAVDPQQQRSGVGGALLAAVEAHVREHGAGRPLWCNARLEAVPFYARHGWRMVSEPFDVPGVGPHRRMLRPSPDTIVQP